MKVVLTAFNGNDTQSMRAFVQESERLGMVVFASAGNQPGGPTYPAQYPQTISVAADDPGLAYDGDASQAQWVNFTMNGSVPERLGGRSIDRGSSYASAKAAAFGSYYASYNPAANREDMMNALERSSIETTYKVQGQEVTSLRIDDRQSAQQMVSIAFNDSQIREAPVSSPSVSADHSAAKISEQIAASHQQASLYGP